MLLVTAAPGVIESSAGDVLRINATLAAVRAVIAGPTTEMLAAAEDEISAAVAAFFSAHGRDYQALSIRMAEFGEQFAGLLVTGADSYAAAEAATATPLQAFWRRLLGR
ncbi:PE family protein [Mycobacterium sp. ML4]